VIVPEIYVFSSKGKGRENLKKRDLERY